MSHETVEASPAPGLRVASDSTSSVERGGAQFNTTTSLGRLTLNILLSFAQFEREIISERTRDKMSAARRKGKWIGGHPVLGYDIDPKGGRLIVNPKEALQVRTLFEMYLEFGSLLPVLQAAARRGLLTKRWTTEDGRVRGGQGISKGTLHGILTNAIYTGMVDHKGALYPGEHDRIVDQNTWDRVHETLQRNGADKGASIRNKFGASRAARIMASVSASWPAVATGTCPKAERAALAPIFSTASSGTTSATSYRLTSAPSTSRAPSTTAPDM
jgi:hypothetical protein